MSKYEVDDGEMLYTGDDPVENGALQSGEDGAFHIYISAVMDVHDEPLNRAIADWAGNDWSDVGLKFPFKPSDLLRTLMFELESVEGNGVYDEKQKFMALRAECEAMIDTIDGLKFNE